MIFTCSLLWYSVATVVMAFQNHRAGILIWRIIAGIGIGVELVTIDTYIAELVPQGIARPRVCLQADRAVSARAGGRAGRLAAGAAPPVGPRRLALGGADRRRRARCLCGSSGDACRKVRAG